ncbi:hypothetical protein D3C87_2143910 [compost metagenome]
MNCSGCGMVTSMNRASTTGTTPPMRKTLVQPYDGTMAAAAIPHNDAPISAPQPMVLTRKALMRAGAYS